MLGCRSGREEFKVISAARDAGWAIDSLDVAPQSVVDPKREFTNEELANGVKPKRVSKPAGPRLLHLEGAEHCLIDDRVVSVNFVCVFPLGAVSDVVAKEAYVSAVRLVGKATKQKITDVPQVQETEGSILRWCGFAGLLVGETWLKDPQKASENNITITVLGPLTMSQKGPLTDPVTPTLWDVKTSGSAQAQYSQMPRAEKLGSTGVGPASITVVNDTDFKLTLSYNGPSLQSVTLLVACRRVTISIRRES